MNKGGTPVGWSVRKMSDIDEPRPRYAPTPKAPKGCGREYGLYLADLNEDVMIDKYGSEKGSNMYLSSIGQGKNGNAIYGIAQTITDEKFQMCKDLGIELDHYFERSYLSLWKEWKELPKNKK
eukprot:TRINITY_DN6333_c0_g1_i1.p1 TRINITY_DN6333_c0_g1~~TRINITY_DN6333_c0_g1_i1.p1  ORF type:complete len:123 (-),score=23.06 TRINITY_DN6333_c0_g1_i1:13-381(-)